MDAHSPCHESKFSMKILAYETLCNGSSGFLFLFVDFK